ncbi:MAG: carboxypeptidase-like regulatory domain-containing protein, partial [Candidatus Brocadia sp.]
MTVTNLSTYAGTCQVWGYVFDDQDGDHTYDAGEGISGHLSKIYNQSYTFTDPDGRGANGKYIVFAPTPATYTLLASASGYGTATRSITLSSSQMSKREDFELQPLPAGSAASFENDNASIPQLPEHAIQMLGDIKGQILSLDPAVFKTPDRREALIKQYDTAIR